MSSKAKNMTIRVDLAFYAAIQEAAQESFSSVSNWTRRILGQKLRELGKLPAFTGGNANPDPQNENEEDVPF